MRHNSQNTRMRRSLLPPPPLRAWLFGISLLAAVTVLALLGECGAASDPEEPHDATPGASAGKSAAPPAGNSPSFDLEAEGSVLAPADIDGAGMAVSRASVKASAGTEHFACDMGYTGSHFDFSNVGHLPFGGRIPFEDLHRFELGLTVRGGLWGNVGGFATVRGGLGFEREPGASGFDGTALAGLRVPLGTKWTVHFGGGVAGSKVETQAIPVLGFDYESGDRFAAALGFPHTEISWRGGTWWNARLTGGIEAGFYGLADDNPIARKGSVAVFSPQTGLWFDLRPFAGLSASIGALYALPGTMTFYRESGARIKRFDVGGAPGGALRLRYEF
jgi:opacity protein-like surface antigen